MMVYRQAMNHIQQVTVFGGSGLIGRAIVRALAQQGLQVHVACRRPELAEVTKTAGDVGQIVLMRANLRMPQSIVAAIAGSQAVVNATGIPFQKGRQKYQSVHVAGARALADAATAAGVRRLIHISGIGADNRSSRNAFVKSKVEGESAVVAGFPAATILRPSVVFGPDDKFFNRLAQAAVKAPFMPLVGRGTARVQPVYDADVGRAVVAVLERPATTFGVFELGGPRIYTYREIAALILREIGRTKPIVSVPAGLLKLAAFFAEFLPVPPITRDQVELMIHDNVVREGAQTFATLGIEPIAVEPILPVYLDRYRHGGRYNQHAPA
jgi:uncharacterized protein YbjT (DUF2867 family)